MLYRHIYYLHGSSRSMMYPIMTHLQNRIYKSTSESFSQASLPPSAGPPGIHKNLYTAVSVPLPLPFRSFSRSSPRPISNSQLHALLHFHLCPIYLIVSQGPYCSHMGYLILRGASRLDAFSVYPFRTRLPGYALGSTTGTPAVRPSRSSRTKDSSSQISCAHAG